MAHYLPEEQSRPLPGTRLGHGDYTVGWICALPCELAAAEAMFDVVHDPLPNPSHDKNVYVLGSISGHNVVVTTLPIGIYGTTSATAVAVRMVSTFKSITIPLLVGIGGGVPSHDIRLGDVVVSIPTPGRHAVVQYDYGKTLASGTMQITGTLDKPASQLLASVSRFRARYSSQPSCIPETMRVAMRDQSHLDESFTYPGPEKDILYANDCSHSTRTRECETCDPRLVEREYRPNSGPQIHYGTIASGNQVIKNSMVRDTLASMLGNLCFEMEAAGIMDHFPALVVRGICDYCDSRKNKDFQNYAALAAAAFAKELLSIVPRIAMASLSETVIKPRYEEIEILNFSEANSRQMTIKDAHPDTLGWVLQHKAYISWLDDSQFPSHRGFLWIKAKPGAGKSTMMKYILSHVKRTSPFTISFFFLARGTELQKTTRGMYRSLLYQLLNHFPELRHLLELPVFERELDHLDLLKSLFRTAIRYIRQPLTCFIDALDESSEDEIRDLLEDLESINENAIYQCFRVCCSSRYYPTLSIEAGLDLFLDKEVGHMTDITNYVKAKLRIGRSMEAREIENEVVSRSAGIFLWVVLVVQILKREYDRGRIHAMQAKLKVIPSGINELIRNILLRDNENLQDLVYSIQWALYSDKPLSIREFYYALLLSDEGYDLASWQRQEVTHYDMERFITNSSKGLLERTKGGLSQIQFIHESVREFLLECTLTDIWSGFDAVARGYSHDKIAQRCLRYLIDHPWHYSSYMLVVDDRPPLLDYMRAAWAFHAEAAESEGISQHALLNSLLALDRETLQILTSYTSIVVPFQAHSEICLFLVMRKFPALLRRCLTSDFPYAEKITSARARNDLLICCISSRIKEPFYILLEPAPSREMPVEYYVGDSTYERPVDSSSSTVGNSFLLLLVREPECKLAKYLLQAQEWAEMQDQEWLTRLVVGCALRQLTPFRDNRKWLPSENDIYLFGAKLEILSLAAVYEASVFYLEQFLNLGCDPNSRTSYGWTLLHVAVAQGHTHIVARLAQIADLEATDNFSLTPLELALICGRNDIIEILTRQGASIDTACTSRRSEHGQPVLDNAELDRHKVPIDAVLQSQTFWKHFEIEFDQSSYGLVRPSPDSSPDLYKVDL